MKRSRHGNCWNVCLRDMRDLASGSDCRNRDSVGSNSRHKNNPMGVRASGDGAPRRRAAAAAITERGRSGSASNRNLEWGGPEESTHSLSLRGGKRTTGKKHGPGRRRLLVTLLICGRCSPLYCSLFLALPVFVQTLPCSFIMQPLFPCASRACYPRLAMLNQ